MRVKWVAILALMGGACLFAAPVGASEREEVNNFYEKVKKNLKIKNAPHLKGLAALVEKNPRIAERCLAVCGQKAGIPGKEGEALSMIRDELQTVFFLRTKPSKCDADYMRRVLEIAQPPQEDDDQIFCLERLVSFCPNAGDAYIALADLYLKQRRCGMAIATYEKAVALTGDTDSKKLLKEARDCKEDYVKQKPLQIAEVKELVFKHGLMAPQSQIGRKATIENRIQRQIHFDEWSFQIKPQYLTDLKVMGEGWREELAQHPGVRLVIEGHTDKRGPYDRNMQLSKDRAEAIKTYLVRNYRINPDQLTTEGYGPARPYSPDDNEAGWALNRRVEFTKLDSEQ